MAPVLTFASGVVGAALVLADHQGVVGESS